MSTRSDGVRCVCAVLDVLTALFVDAGQSGAKGDVATGGNPEEAGNSNTPKLLENLLGKGVMQVACGWSHTAVLLGLHVRVLSILIVWCRNWWCNDVWRSRGHWPGGGHYAAYVYQANLRENGVCVCARVLVLIRCCWLGRVELVVWFVSHSRANGKGTRANVGQQRARTARARRLQVCC